MYWRVVEKADRDNVLICVAQRANCLIYIVLDYAESADEPPLISGIRDELLKYTKVNEESNLTASGNWSSAESCVVMCWLLFLEVV